MVRFPNRLFHPLDPKAKFFSSVACEMAKEGLEVRRIFGELQAAGRPLYLVDLNHAPSFAYFMEHLLNPKWLPFLFPWGIPSGFLRHTVSDFWVVAAKEKERVRPSELEHIARESFRLSEAFPLTFLIYSGLEVATFLVFEREGKRPAGILKAARDPVNESLEREFEILSHVFQNASSSFRSTLPAPLGLTKIQGLPVLSLGFVEGRRKRWTKRKSGEFETDFRKIRAWISELNRISVPPSKKKVARFASARERIKRLAARSAPGAKMLEAVERAFQYDDPKAEAQIPTVVTHRDLAPSNLLFDGTGIRVVDWGNSHYGYPLTDWVRFVCNVLAARDLDRSLRELLSGRSRFSPVFYEAAKELGRDISLGQEWLAPLFLLSLFDFLESYHLSKEGPWEERYRFILEKSDWLAPLTG